MIVHRSENIFRKVIRMSKEKINIFCALIVAVSIVISGFLLSGRGNNDKNALITKTELASYLHISVNDINQIINKEAAWGPKDGSGNVNDFFYLPYIKINNIMYFNKYSVDKWIVEKLTARIKY